MTTPFDPLEAAWKHARPHEDAPVHPMFRAGFELAMAHCAAQARDLAADLDRLPRLARQNQPVAADQPEAFDTEVE